MSLLALWLSAAGAVSFFLMGYDKSRARRGLRRVPERTLWLAALLGGGLGGLLGMRVFRHKTRHRSFAVGFPLLAALQAGALVGLAVGALSWLPLPF